MSELRNAQPRRHVVYVAACVAAALVCLALLVASCGGPYYFGSVSFTDPENGWATGWDDAAKKTLLYRTTDGGETWAQAGAEPTTSSATVVGWTTFVSADRGFWCVSIDRLLATTDGGATWAVAPVSGMDGGYVTAVDFAGPTVGWASGSNTQMAGGGSVAKSTDAGLTWEVKKRIDGDSGSGAFVGVAGTSDLVCHAVKRGARYGVWTTTDGGTTWARHRLPTRVIDHRRVGARTYNNVFFADTLTGWAVGDYGLIARTTDGGVTWARQRSGLRNRLSGIWFTSPAAGCVVGNRGVILTTTDGGRTWVRRASKTRVNLRDVQFVSPDEGWAIAMTGIVPGQTNMVRHTTDGGVTWTR